MGSLASRRGIFATLFYCMTTTPDDLFFLFLFLISDYSLTRPRRGCVVSSATSVGIGYVGTVF